MTQRSSSEPDKPGSALRAVLGGLGCAIALGANDPVLARMAEQAGFPVIYVSGSGAASTVGGLADVGLFSYKEMLDHAQHVVAATSTPTLCDIDTGYGNATQVARTVREYDGCGAAGVHLEDQTFPKRCGQTSGTTVVPAAEMCSKLYAAKDAQRSDEFVVIARTDAREPEGLDGVIKRCRAYAAAGADAIFPEALRDKDELRAVRESLDPEIPLVIDVPEWGKSPMFSVAELNCAGFALAIYAVSARRVMLRAAEQFLDFLQREGTQAGWIDRMMSRDELDALVGLPQIRVNENALVRRGEHAAEVSGFAPSSDGPS
jgi:2-methylisocitrate lyase-like PEP mutase family enzyme